MSGIAVCRAGVWKYIPINLSVVDTPSTLLSLKLWFTWKQPGDLCDHRTVWTWRDFKDHLIPTPLPWMILLALLFTASAGRWIFNDPNYHPQELRWPKSQMWPWQLQSLHCVIDLVLAATLNSSIKNSKDLPSTLFIVIEDLHYSHVWTLKHNLSFIITFIPFFFLRQTIYQWRHHHKNIDPVHTWHKMLLISVGLWDLAHSHKHFPWSPVLQSTCKPSLLLPYTTTVQQQSHQDIFQCWGRCWFKPFPSFVQLSCFTSSGMTCWSQGRGGCSECGHGKAPSAQLAAFLLSVAENGL